MSGFLFYFAALACLVTLGILAFGVLRFGTGFSKGIEGARKSNRLMRWRIVAQLVAVILIVLVVVAAQSGR